MVWRKWRRIFLHGHRKRQPCIREALHSEMRLLQIPYAVNLGPPGLRASPPPRPPGHHHQTGHRRRRGTLPPPLLLNGVLPARHRRGAQQQAQPGHVPGRAQGILRRRVMAGIGRVPVEPARVVGRAERVELPGRVQTGGARRVAREESIGEDESGIGPGSPVAAPAVRPRSVQAVRVPFLIRAGRGGPERGEDDPGPVRVGPQHGEGERVRGGGDGGGEEGAAEVRNTALGKLIVRRGFMVHKAVGGRLQ